MRIAYFSIDDGPCQLADDEIHLWSAPLDRLADESLLTPAECDRANRFKMERIRRQFVAARGHLRLILSGYLGIEPGAVPISTEPTGKPILEPELSQGLHFNVAHSAALAVYAVTRRGRIGVDVERWREVPNADALVERFFTRQERDLWRAMPDHERPAAFFRAWTCKEAALKAIGQGVQSLDQCDVTFGVGEPEMVLRMGEDTCARERWLLRTWRPAAEFVAAVALELK